MRSFFNGARSIATVFFTSLSPLRPAAKDFGLCYNEALYCIENEIWWAADAILQRMTNLPYYHARIVKIQSSDQLTTTTDINLLLCYVALKRNDMLTGLSAFCDAVYSPQNDAEKRDIDIKSANFVSLDKLEFIFERLSKWVSFTIKSKLGKQAHLNNIVADAKANYSLEMVWNYVKQNDLLRAMHICSHLLDNNPKDIKLRLARLRIANLISPKLLDDPDHHKQIILIDFVILTWDGGNFLKKILALVETYKELMKESDLAHAQDYQMILKCFYLTCILSLEQAEDWIGFAQVIDDAYKYYMKHKDKFAQRPGDMFVTAGQQIIKIRTKYVEQIKNAKAKLQGPPKIIESKDDKVGLKDIKDQTPSLSSAAKTEIKADIEPADDLSAISNSDKINNTNHTTPVESHTEPTFERVKKSGNKVPNKIRRTAVTQRRQRRSEKFNTQTVESVITSSDEAAGAENIIPIVAEVAPAAAEEITPTVTEVIPAVTAAAVAPAPTVSVAPATTVPTASISSAPTIVEKSAAVVQANNEPLILPQVKGHEKNSNKRKAKDGAEQKPDQLHTPRASVASSTSGTSTPATSTPATSTPTPPSSVSPISSVSSSPTADLKTIKSSPQSSSAAVSQKLQVASSPAAVQPMRLPQPLAAPVTVMPMVAHTVSPAAVVPPVIITVPPQLSLAVPTPTSYVMPPLDAKFTSLPASSSLALPPVNGYWVAVSQPYGPVPQTQPCWQWISKIDAAQCAPIIVPVQGSYLYHLNFIVPGEYCLVKVGPVPQQFEQYTQLMQNWSTMFAPDVYSAHNRNPIDALGRSVLAPPALIYTPK